MYNNISVSVSSSLLSDDADSDAFLALTHCKFGFSPGDSSHDLYFYRRVFRVEVPVFHYPFLARVVCDRRQRTFAHAI